MKQMVPCHCGFYVTKETGLLELAIAWRRIGAKDYGIFIQQSNGKIKVCNFLGQYGSHGELLAFYITQELLQVPYQWYKEVLSEQEINKPIERQDVNVLSELNEYFCTQWLETLGYQETQGVLSAYLPAPTSAFYIEHLFQGVFPLKIKSEKMPDFWSFVIESSDAWDFSLMASGLIVNKTLDALLVEKMRLFVELM